MLGFLFNTIHFGSHLKLGIFKILFLTPLPDNTYNNVCVA